MTNFWTSTLS